MHPPADQRLAGLRQGHQAGGDIGVIPQDIEGAPGRAAKRAHPEHPLADAAMDGDPAFQARPNLQRGLHRPPDIIFVGFERAKTRQQVRALIPNIERQQHSFLPRQDPLHLADEAAQLRASLVILVVVDAGKADEDRGCRAQFRGRGPT